MCKEDPEKIRRTKRPGKRILHDEAGFPIKGEGSKKKRAADPERKASGFGVVFLKSLEASEKPFTAFPSFPGLLLPLEGTHRRPGILGGIRHFLRRVEKKRFLVQQKRTLSCNGKIQHILRLVKGRIAVERLQSGQRDPSSAPSVFRPFGQHQSSFFRNEKRRRRVCPGGTGPHDSGTGRGKASPGSRLPGKTGGIKRIGGNLPEKPLSLFFRREGFPEGFQKLADRRRGKTCRPVPAFSPHIADPQRRPGGKQNFQKKMEVVFPDRTVQGRGDSRRKSKLWATSFRGKALSPIPRRQTIRNGMDRRGTIRPNVIPPEKKRSRQVVRKILRESISVTIIQSMSSTSWISRQSSRSDCPSAKRSLSRSGSRTKKSDRSADTDSAQAERAWRPESLSRQERKRSRRRNRMPAFSPWGSSGRTKGETGKTKPCSSIPVQYPSRIRLTAQSRVWSSGSSLVLSCLSTPQRNPARASASRSSDAIFLSSEKTVQNGLKRQEPLDERQRQGKDGKPEKTH